MEHESDGDTNYNWRERYSHQRISKWTGRLGNKRTSGIHPNYSIVEIGLNTKKSPGDLRRLAVTQTLVESGNTGVNNSQRSKIIIIYSEKRKYKLVDKESLALLQPKETMTALFGGHYYICCVPYLKIPSLEKPKNVFYVHNVNKMPLALFNISTLYQNLELYNYHY